MNRFGIKRQSRILIVDDDPGTIRVLAEILKDLGKIHFTTKGSEAMDMALSISPDFIILDVEMPDMNGIDVCDLIKSNPAFKDVPVLFVTGHNDIDLETRALTAGAIDFIQKPPHANVVEQRVKNYLALKQRTDHLQKLAQAVEQSSDSMVITDIDANIEYVNATFSRNTGYSHEEVIGKNPRILSSGKTSLETYRSMWSNLAMGYEWRGELINRRKDGSEYIESAVISPIRQEDGRITHYLAVKSDITGQKLAQGEIQRLGYFDSLTQLPNRRQFQDRVGQTLASIQRSKLHSAVLVADLDGFKVINDTLGHSVGDRLLLEISTRLRQNCLRAHDLLARLGGDEFAILTDDLDEDYAEAAGQAKSLAAKVLKAIEQTITLDGVSHRATASIGIYLLSGNPEETIDDAMKRAEVAMYRAKAAGRNCLSFFDPKIQVELERQASLELDLRNALGNQQLQLAFQPQFDTSKQLTGAEVLMRWNHPQRGMVSPAEFIPIAEACGTIVPFGLWILGAACDQLNKWNAQHGWEKFRISVNVSPRQLREADFVPNVIAIVASSGIAPENLMLEITESGVLEDIEGSIAKMNQLKKLGITFSMDDFGTGNSSLSNLKRLPLTELKIDQSFVRDIGVDPNDEIIVKTIIAMGQSLGMHVIAEGVETTVQEEMLRKHGCTNFQGYLFGRPVPSREFEVAFAFSVGSRRVPT